MICIRYLPSPIIIYVNELFWIYNKVSECLSMVKQCDVMVRKKVFLLKSLFFCSMLNVDPEDIFYLNLWKALELLTSIFKREKENKLKKINNINWNVISSCCSNFQTYITSVARCQHMKILASVCVSSLLKIQSFYSH